MSDIVIKNPPFDFPDGCYGCPFLMGKANCKCLFMDKTVRIETIREEYEDKYLEGCPIKELPPHGELKDADAIVNTTKEIYCKGCNNYGGVMCRACLLDDCLSCIDDAPTILEASNEEKNK